MALNYATGNMKKIYFFKCAYADNIWEQNMDTKELKENVKIRRKIPEVGPK